LRPHPEEAQHIMKIFDLRARGTMRDMQILQEVNKLGYRGRVHYVRDKHNRSKVLTKRGGDTLTLKALERIVSNPIYAGVNAEKWTGGKPVQCAFNGLVSIEQF